MRKPPKSKKARKQKRESEVEEFISWIESQKPDCGSNPMSLPPLPTKLPIGRLDSTPATFSRYAGTTSFHQLPISKRTKDALRRANLTHMTDIQRASLPHALCSRDILGAAKTGSGKTLAFVIPVVEKLHRERWNPEDGEVSIIISPTRELAAQTFDVLKYMDVQVEKERVNGLNILVCTPGRLLQHMDETPNFDCSQLQVLVLDEADRILDVGFKKTLNAVISQLPKRRQTLLFSATQTKSVQDLARLSLKGPEHAVWSFIKAHLNSRILVFLSTRKQVKFVFEAFKKLRPGIPLKCLHGKMKQEGRMGTYSQFHEKPSVLFSTDVASRGLNFNKAVDWVVQVDCPEDVASYIHRVGRTARYHSEGRSVLFLMPSELKMLEKLDAARIPIQRIKANNKRLQPVSSLLSSLLVKYPDTLLGLAKRAFITYLKSIQNHKDKEIFNVSELPLNEFSASMGLPMTPRIRFPNQKMKSKTAGELYPIGESESSHMENGLEIPKEELDIDNVPATRVMKKRKLNLTIYRPMGTRVVFDDSCKPISPFAKMAGTIHASDPILLDELKDKKHKYYDKVREELKRSEPEDKILDRQRCNEKRRKKKMKRSRVNEGEEEQDDLSDSKYEYRPCKRVKNKKCKEKEGVRC
ncbi:DEAD-box ATP-dependent RNA helicase 32 [Rosa sericea]